MIQQGTSLADRCGKEDDPPNETLNTDRQKAGGRLALRYAIFLSVIIDPRLTFHQRLVGVIRTPYLLSFC